MKFPDTPTCHSDARRALPDPSPIVWSQPRHPTSDSGPVVESFRRCSYCGSIHPEDLLRVLADGARMHGSDWKYSWPHKFYVEVPNRVNPAVEVEIGARYDGSAKKTPIMGTIEWFHAKWYNEHLHDEMDNEARAALLAAIEKHSGIRFEVEGDKLKYRAPSFGYQR